MSSFVKQVRRTVIVLSVFGMLCPSITIANEPLTSALKVHDVQLTENGKLPIVVVNAQGKPQPNVTFEITRAGDAECITGVTGEAGEYQVEGLKGGVYQIRTDQGLCACRVWTHQAAPPTSAKSLLLVNDRVVRGQRPISELFRSDPILMTAIVAAAIAIPIVIHQTRDKSSGS